VGRDITALFHTYHRDPRRLMKILARYRIDDVGAGHVIPNLGLPPFLLPAGFDAATDLPQFEFGKANDLREEVVREVESRAPRERLKRYDNLFDVIGAVVFAGHVAVMSALVLGWLPAWACVLLLVLTRTSLAGAGHFYLHRRKPRRPSRVLAVGMMPSSLFDFNYVGTYLVGVDGHVILHHPYLGSGADIKGAFLGGLRRVHPALRVPAYTLQKLGMVLFGIARLGFMIIFLKSRRGGIRAEFFLVRLWFVAECVACVVTGHWLAWLVQFVLTLWFNTVLITASHDFEPDERDAPVDGLPEGLRDDWAARQIYLSYDLRIAGNKWVDVFLSAGLNTHRVHHTLPFQRSGFANIVSEPAVRAACEAAGVVWERPRNLFTERFPVFVRSYLLAPKAVDHRRRSGLGAELAGACRYVADGWRTGED
jgi:fatty acid desaturase